MAKHTLKAHSADSFLSEEEQRWLFEAMDYAQASPSLSQSHRLKELSKEKLLSEEKVREILSEVKKEKPAEFPLKMNSSIGIFQRIILSHRSKQKSSGF